MRFRNGLAVFQKTNVKGSPNILSYHSPHSLTWRWILSFSRFRGDEARVWPLFMPYRSNVGLQWSLRIPFLGIIRFSQQRPMWYRDVYSRQRDKIDQERYQKSSMDYSSSRPNVVDGGQALH